MKPVNRPSETAKKANKKRMALCMIDPEAMSVKDEYKKMAEAWREAEVLVEKFKEDTDQC